MQWAGSLLYFDRVETSQAWLSYETDSSHNYYVGRILAVSPSSLIQEEANK